jgi:hypothetical protein
MALKLFFFSPSKFAKNQEDFLSNQISKIHIEKTQLISNFVNLFLVLEPSHLMMQSEESWVLEPSHLVMQSEESWVLESSHLMM